MFRSLVLNLDERICFFEFYMGNLRKMNIFRFVNEVVLVLGNIEKRFKKWIEDFDGVLENFFFFMCIVVWVLFFLEFLLGSIENG